MPHVFYMPKGGDPKVLRYTWPPRDASSGTGGLISSDCMAVMANAEHPVLAHEFLNFMLNTDNALENFGWNGYQPPVTALDPETMVADGWVPENLASAVVAAEDFDLGQVPVQLTPQVDQQWKRVWSTAQSG